MLILVIRNNSNSHAVDASLLLATYLASQGIDHVLVDSTKLVGPAETGEVRALVARGVDMAVVLGGDGTILRTARQIGEAGVPILGINFGRLGFLANASDDGVVAIMAAALAGDVVRERRANLRIDVVCEGEADPWADDADCAGGAADGSASGSLQGLGEDANAKAQRRFFALNELAITRGANGRLIDFSFGVSGAHVADMRGDGLVVATATGSTGYALSAGGPLVAPGFGGLVVAPLAPHTLHSRALVTAESDVVDVELKDQPASAYPREATLFVDGELLEFPAPVRRAYVRRGDQPTILLRYQREGFYEHVAKTFF